MAARCSGWGRPRLLDATDRLRIGDQLVIAAFAEFPLSESSIKNPVPAGEHWLPGPNPGGAQAAWGIDSLGGTEHFLVFIAPDRVDWLQAAWDSCPKPKSVSGSGITAFRDVLRGAGIVATAAPADDVGDNARLIDQLKAAARSLERDDGVEMIDLVAIDADVASTFAIALLSSVDCRGAVISTDFAPAWTFAFSVVIATRWYSASQRASSSFACA